MSSRCAVVGGDEMECVYDSGHKELNHMTADGLKWWETQEKAQNDNQRGSTIYERDAAKVEALRAIAGQLDKIARHLKTPPQFRHLPPAPDKCPTCGGITEVCNKWPCSR